MMLKARLLNLGLSLKTAGWKTWLVIAVVALVAGIVLKFVLGGGFIQRLFSSSGQRAQDEALKAAGRLERSIGATRDRIRQADAELEARHEELDGIKAEPDKMERLRRLAELADRQSRRP